MQRAINIPYIKGKVITTISQPAQKLTDPTTSFKIYWSISITFVNAKKTTTPLIPLLNVASKCTPITNDNLLPSFVESQFNIQLICY